MQHSWRREFPLSGVSNGIVASAGKSMVIVLLWFEVEFLLIFSDFFFFKICHNLSARFFKEKTKKSVDVRA